MGPTKEQGDILWNSFSALMNSTATLRNAIKKKYAHGMELKNGITVKVQQANAKTVRGYSLVCALIDEGMWLTGANGSARSDTSLVKALLPKLLVCHGRLIIISSKAGPRGYCYDKFKSCFGNDRASTLVWSPPGPRVMNPTISASALRRAKREDPEMARVEFGNDFAEDGDSCIDREMLERLVVEGRQEVLPHQNIEYSAFVDLSHGAENSDDATLAIAYRSGDTVVLCKMKRYRPPFSVTAIVRDMANLLKRYRITRVVADGFSESFVSEAFRANGIKYVRSDLNKSELYADLLPRLASGSVELLDSSDTTLIDQLCTVERSPTGRYSVRRGLHDDASDALAGACYVASKGVVHAGAVADTHATDDMDPRERARLEEMMQTLRPARPTLQDIYYESTYGGHPF
jgi:hypothetical protein